MKKIIIRIESHSSSWVWWMESRIKEFTKVLENDYTFLTNSKFLYKSKFFGEKNIFSNYFSFVWILKDIFSFRNFDLIDSNWLRDNLISSLNFLLFWICYKVRKTEFFLTIHWNQGIEENKWIKKIVYDFLFKIWLLLSNKVIVVSEELKFYLIKKYSLNPKKIEIIPNFVKFQEKKFENKNNKSILVSRLDNHKSQWILKAIDFCLENNLELDIYWSGSQLENLKEKFKTEEKINFLWFVRQEEIDYRKYNLIFAMWRALLEWIANNLSWILLWYDDLVCIVSEQNYKKIKFSNFSWRWVEKEEIDLGKIFEEKNKIFELVKNDFDIKNLKNFYNKKS